MKKICVVLCAIAMFMAASAAVMSSWVKVSDPDCDNCVMDDTTRKCGKCGGFMQSVKGTGKAVEGNYIQYDYKCKVCSHTITYKNR